MEQRARAIVYWPGMSKDICETREGCADCNRNAPSQAATPPLPSQPPSTPFEAVFADFFDYGGRHYLVVGDRLSGWTEVLSSTAGTPLGSSAGLVRHLRSFFSTFGVPQELSSDGGPEFTAGQREEFLQLWGVKHRIYSVSFPQSNGRAEVAVKTAKRLLQSNTGPTGSLDHDRFLRAILQLRNTPDPDCNHSPAQKGPNPTKWDRSGVVMESPGHDQYRVKVDGSGRLTLRNRRFLRSYTPATPSITPRQQTEADTSDSGAREWQTFPPTATAPDCLQEEEPQETIAPPDPTKHTAGDPPTPLHQLAVAPSKTHPQCRHSRRRLYPTTRHVCDGHPSVTSQKQDNGSHESAYLRRTSSPKAFGLGGMKGPPADKQSARNYS